MNCHSFTQGEDNHKSFSHFDLIRVGMAVREPYVGRALTRQFRECHGWRFRRALTNAHRSTTAGFTHLDGLRPRCKDLVSCTNPVGGYLGFHLPEVKTSGFICQRCRPRLYLPEVKTSALLPEVKTSASCLSNCTCTSSNLRCEIQKLGVSVNPR